MTELLQNVEFWKALPPLFWPLVAIIVLWKLWPVLRGILVSRQFTIKVGEFELSAQDASDQMQKSVSDLQTRLAEIETALADAARSAPETSEEQPPLDALQTRLTRASETAPEARPDRDRPFRILWVDDQPKNNAGEALTLREIGCTITNTLSTEEAMRSLEHQAFDLIISDIGRPEGRDAGVVLLETLRARGNSAPFAFFSSRRALARYAERIRLGNVVVATNSFVDLLKAVKRLQSKQDL